MTAANITAWVIVTAGLLLIAWVAAHLIAARGSNLEPPSADPP